MPIQAGATRDVPVPATNKFVSDTLGLNGDLNPSPVIAGHGGRTKTYLDASVTTKIARSSLADANRMAAAKQRERKAAILQQMGVYDSNKVPNSGSVPVGGSVGESDSDSDVHDLIWGRDDAKPRRPKSEPLYSRSDGRKSSRKIKEENPTNAGSRGGEGTRQHSHRRRHRHSQGDEVDQKHASRSSRRAAQEQSDSKSSFVAVSKHHARGNAVGPSAAVRDSMRGSPFKPGPDVADTEVAEYAGKEGNFSGSDAESEVPVVLVSATDSTPHTSESLCYEQDPERFPSRSSLGSDNTQHRPQSSQQHRQYQHHIAQTSPVLPQPLRTVFAPNDATHGTQLWDHNAMISPKSKAAGMTVPGAQGRTQSQQLSSGCHDPSCASSNCAPCASVFSITSPPLLDPYDTRAQSRGPSTDPAASDNPQHRQSQQQQQQQLGGQPVAGQNWKPPRTARTLSPRAAAILDAKDTAHLSFSQLKKQLTAMKQQHQQPASKPAASAAVPEPSPAVPIPSESRASAQPVNSDRACAQPTQPSNSRRASEPPEAVFNFSPSADSFTEVGVLPHAIRPRRASLEMLHDDASGAVPLTQDSERAARYLAMPPASSNTELRPSPVPQLQSQVSPAAFFPASTATLSGRTSPAPNVVAPVAQHAAGGVVGDAVPLMLTPGAAAHLQALLSSAAPPPPPVQTTRPVLVPVRVTQETPIKQPKAQKQPKAAKKSSGASKKKSNAKAGKKTKSSAKQGKKGGKSNAVGAAHVAAAMSVPVADLIEILRTREQDLNSSFDTPATSPRSTRSQYSMSSRGSSFSESVADVPSDALAARAMDMLLDEVKGLDALSRGLTARAQLSRWSAEQAAYHTRGDVDDEDLSKVWGGMQRSPVLPKGPAVKGTPPRKTKPVPTSASKRDGGDKRGSTRKPAPVASLSPRSDRSTRSKHSSRSGSSSLASQHRSWSSQLRGDVHPSPSKLSSAGSIVRVHQAECTPYSGRRRSSVSSSRQRSISAGSVSSSASDKYGGSIRQQIRAIRNECTAKR